MKRSSRRVLSSLLFAAFLFLPGPWPAGGQSAPADGVSGEEFLRTFLDAFADRYEISAVSGPGLVTFDSWRFRSIAPLPDSTPPVYLRFRLRRYRYSDPSQAAAALQGLASEVAGSMFFKSPMLVTVRDQDLFRLDGACTFSASKWRDVERRLMESLFAGDHLAGPTLQVTCGGEVKSAP